MAKRDYSHSTFTTCIQQPALLDHRSAIDINLDDGVSLSALCDLKLSGDGLMGTTTENEKTQSANYKVLPPLMAGVEANEIMTGLQKINATTSTCINFPTFQNILYTRDYIPQFSSTTTAQPHYLTPKVNKVENSGESTHQQHHIPNTEIANTARQISPPYEFLGREIKTHGRNGEGNFENNISDYGIASTSSSDTHNMSNSSEGSTNHNRFLNENHTTTTTATQIVADTPKTNVTYQTSSIATNQSHSQQKHTITTLHRIEELAASSCTLTTSTTSLINTHAKNNEDTTFVSLTNNNNNANVTHQQQQHLHSHDSTSDSLNYLHQQHLFHQQQSQQQQSQQQQSQHQQHLPNSSTISSHSNNSEDESIEFIDMKLNESLDYQNKQRKGGGAGITPSSNQQHTSNTAGISNSLAPHLAGNHLENGTSASAYGCGSDIIDIKHIFEESCPVCGDKVSGYHYGLLTCESCKGFFKRTVQNKKSYTCVAERSCHIDKTQRKRCPYCRFQKCLEVGMKLEAVRADRMRGGRNSFGPMYKRDRVRKLQVIRQRQMEMQSLRTSMGTGNVKSTSLSAPGYQQAYTHMNITQDIQNPQVSSLTKSPDTSPCNTAVDGESDNCHQINTGCLQSASYSKLGYNSTTHPASNGDSIEQLGMPLMIRELIKAIDDREWQMQLFALLRKQTHSQDKVDLFELMCKILDQNLFSQIDWARNCPLFKYLVVDDQMILVQHSWSDILVLDHLYHRLYNGLPDEAQLSNGQAFNLLSLGLLGVLQLSDYFNELQNKLHDLNFDTGDYVCMKLLILLNPDVRGLRNKSPVLQHYESVHAALLDYTLKCYPFVTNKFRRLLSIVPDIRAIAARGEDYLNSKHCDNSAPTKTLLMELLHAKRKL